MKWGIVGSEAAKFDGWTEQIARATIRTLISKGDTVISGACPLGGIDIWAIEEAKKKKLKTVEFPPTIHRWSGKGGFQERNIKIAEEADSVVCFTVRSLPLTFKGPRFEYCYHCETDEHIKSGGCWTVKYAIGLGKIGRVIVIGK